MGTMAGQPLYEAAGFQVLEHRTDSTGGAPVPLVRMRKTITATATVLAEDLGMTGGDG